MQKEVKGYIIIDPVTGPRPWTFQKLKKDTIDCFELEYNDFWKEYKDRGYKCVKCTLTIKTED